MDKEYKKNLGELIIYKMKEKGFTYRNLGDKIGMGAMTLHNKCKLGNFYFTELVPVFQLLSLQLDEVYDFITCENFNVYDWDKRGENN